MLQTDKSNKWHCLCQNRVQIWNPWGQKHMKRAFTHEPTTFSYKVMTKANIGWRPYWILRLWRPQWEPALAPSKNEFSMFWSASVPNFMLVDKCAHKIPKPPDYDIWHTLRETRPFLSVYLHNLISFLRFVCLHFVFLENSSTSKTVLRGYCFWCKYFTVLGFLGMLFPKYSVIEEICTRHFKCACQCGERCVNYSTCVCTIYML